MLPVRAHPHPGLGERKPARAVPVEPFRSVEQAWFWTMAALIARHSGASRPGGGVPRPCEPDDVILCLDALYRRKRIDLAHARVLRTWGERGIAPDARLPAERTEARLWTEAMTLLEWPLRVRGIVADAYISRKIVVDSRVNER
jgi:hypothetical protein